MREVDENLDQVIFNFIEILGSDSKDKAQIKLEESEVIKTNTETLIEDIKYNVNSIELK